MHTMTRWPAGALVISAASLLLAACGGGAPAKNAEAPESPSSAPQPAAFGAGQPGQDAQVVNLPDALAQLDQAETELGQALGAPAFASPPGAGDTTTAPPPAPRTPTTEPSLKSGSAGERMAPQSLSADPCATACRALASMSRSAEHVCGLAGEGDPRCASARARVNRAEGRIQAQCPGCR